MKNNALVLLVTTWLAQFNIAFAADWWRPTPGINWQIQLNGKISTAPRVAMFDLDLYDAPQAVIDKLHQRGVKVVCYFSAGSHEDWRSDANLFPTEVLGLPLDDWPGERWLDVRKIDLLAPLMEARLDLAVAKHCDGVDPDNVDGYANTSGFPLTANDQLAYNRWLAGVAHARGLAVGLKNDLNQVADLVGDFDFAVNEQCVFYQECQLLTPFIDANKPVFGIEYAGKKRKICAEANQRNFDTLLKRLNLKTTRSACRIIKPIKP